jgi:hypothetical protein
MKMASAAWTFYQWVKTPPPFGTHMSIARSAEELEAGRVAANEGGFFCTGPTLELGFAAPGGGEDGMDFDPEDRNGRVELRCSAGLTGQGVVESLVQVS